MITATAAAAVVIGKQLIWSLMKDSIAAVVLEIALT
jgi:hypothetical protein